MYLLCGSEIGKKQQRRWATKRKEEGRSEHRNWEHNTYKVMQFHWKCRFWECEKHFVTYANRTLFFFAMNLHCDCAVPSCLEIFSFLLGFFSLPSANNETKMFVQCEFNQRTRSKIKIAMPTTMQKTMSASELPTIRALTFYLCLISFQ